MPESAPVHGLSFRNQYRSFGHSRMDPAIFEAMDVRWKKPPGGDSTAPDADWVDYPIEWALEAELVFQRFLLEGGEVMATVDPESDEQKASQEKAAALPCRRCLLGLQPGTRVRAAWTSDVAYSVDLFLMTCLEQAEGETRGRVSPLRRFEEGVQTHPPVGRPHPWFLKRIQRRDDKTDWLNNEFFFRAFSKAMAEAGHSVELTADEMFDFRFNQDFRGKPEAEPAQRGGVMYKEPVGWKKFAVKVRGNYDGGSNAWLCLDGRAGEWAVAYHGTNFASLPGIMSSGMRVGERQAYKDHKDKRTGQQIGEGIYCTPSINTAADFSPAVEIDGHSVQFVFQCRVKPEAIKRIHEEVGRESGAYWLINNPADIRPYGVLVREPVPAS